MNACVEVYTFLSLMPLFLEDMLKPTYLSFSIAWTVLLRLFFAALLFFSSRLTCFTFSTSSMLNCIVAIKCSNFCMSMFAVCSAVIGHPAGSSSLSFVPLPPPRLAGTTSVRGWARRADAAQLEVLAAPDVDVAVGAPGLDMTEESNRSRPMAADDVDGSAIKDAIGLT